MDFSALDKALSMDSALEAAIKRLEAYSDVLSTWLEISTAIVVLGVILEIPSIIEFIREALDKRPFIFKALIKPRTFNWKKFRETVGGILVALGVSGELIVGVLISLNETDLRVARGKLTTHARTLAANAVTIASNAESHLQDARKDASNAQERAAKAEKATEDEKIERLKLQALVAPRSLSVEQQRLITATLRKFSGRQATLLSYGLDGEGAALGGQIISILRIAGIAVKDERAQFISTGGFEFGIQIRGPNTEREFMSGIAGALSSIGKLQVAINGPSFRPGMTMGGSANMGGTASMGGGGGVITPDIPTKGPVSIMIGVRPLPVLIAK